MEIKKFSYGISLYFKSFWLLRRCSDGSEQHSMCLYKVQFCLQYLNILIHFMKYPHVNNWRNGPFVTKAAITRYICLNEIKFCESDSLIKNNLYAQPRERSSDRWIKQMTLRRSINLTCGCRWATLLYRARPQNCWALLIMCVIRSGSTYFMPGKWCVFNGSHILPSLCNISDRVPVSLATINQHQGLSG